MVRLAAPLIAGLSLVWFAWIVAAPLLPGAAAALVYLLGSIVCHQLPERSFHIDAAQLPVCARCTGIYAGAAAAAISAVARGRQPWSGVPAVLRAAGPQRARIIVAAALPTVVTVSAEWAGLWQTSNVVRLLAGLPLGVAVALVAIATLHYGECPPRLPPGSSPPR